MNSSSGLHQTVSSSGATRITSSYIITSSPRTGSYLLCEGLADTGIAGVPTEPFCPEYRAEFCQRWQLPLEVEFEPFLASVKQHGTTPNGVFGVKIHWMQAQHLSRDSGFVDTRDGVFECLFPGAKYIHLYRRDRRAQAISYFRALATREWWRIHGVANHQMTNERPKFDSPAIRALELELEEQESAWRAYFDAKGLEPLFVEYETLARKYQPEIGRALSHIGQAASAAAAIPNPRLVRQADGTTQLWKDRLDAEDGVLQPA